MAFEICIMSSTCLLTLWDVCCVFSGGAVQQNGHTTAEIQEEVALTNMGTMATTEKRHSHVNNDKLHFPRANLQTITTLGRLTVLFMNWEWMSLCSALMERDLIIKL